MSARIAGINRRRTARAGSLFGGGLLAGLLLLGSCERPPDKTAPGPGAGAGAPHTGSVTMSLPLRGGSRFGQVGYDVSGNGFHKADSVDTAASTTVSTVIGGIPFGTGYLLKLTAQDADHRLTPCVGSASFDIASRAIFGT